MKGLTMSRKKRCTYSAEFKRNAIALSKEPDKNPSIVEQSLGIPNGLVSKWRRQEYNKGSLAFPGKGIEALTADQKRIVELEKQLRDADMEREILKKALHIFSKASK
jgi:transposase-like protein